MFVVSDGGGGVAVAYCGFFLSCIRSIYVITRVYDSSKACVTGFVFNSFHTQKKNQNKRKERNSLVHFMGWSEYTFSAYIFFFLFRFLLSLFRILLLHSPKAFKRKECEQIYKLIDKLKIPHLKNSTDLVRFPEKKQ